nr:Serine/threonine-protein kinase 16 [Polyrhizophydium stewartii]
MADIQSLSLPSMEISIAACSSQDSGVRKLAQRNIVSWLQNELLPVEALVQVLQTLLVLLDGGPDFEQTADAVAEVLSEHRLRRLTETVVTMALPALTSARMRERLAAAISEEDEGVARVICKMLAEMAENNTEYLWDHILEEHVQALLAMLLDIVSFPGFHGVDQNVSQLPFYFWFVFQEAVSQGIELLPADDRNPKSDAKEAVAMQLFQQLLERLCLQAQFPPAAELQSWKNEARDQFRSHRRECSETMLCCFYVLKTRALQLLVATLGNKISTQSRTEEIEAVIFALKACNEAVDSDESVFLPQVVQASTLQSINTICIQSDTTGQLRNTTLAFIGAYAEWLSRHPDCLPAVFEFLLASLSNARSHSAAASALREVCDLCRLSLAPYADQVINACLAVLPLPDPPSHGKIIESLSMVIQALPATDASPRLNMVLGGILTDLAAAIKQVHGPTATNEQRIAILCQLGYLRSCCHGAGPVGISIAALVDLVEPVPRPSQQEQEIGANIAHAIRITISTWPQDDQMVQGACAVLSQVARSRLPYLVDEGEPLLAFLLESFKATPQTCLLRALVTLSEYMCGVHEDRGDAIRQQLFMAVCTHLLVCFDSIVFLENHPDVVDEFVKLLQKYLSSHGTLVAAMDANVVTAVFATVFLQGLRLQERLAVTAVLKLLTEFVDAGFESSPVESVVKRVLSVSGPSILSGLVVALGGGQPRSLNDKIADVLFAFVAKFPSEARQGLTQCLAAPGFPTQHVSEQDKAKFVKAISRLMPSFEPLAGDESQQQQGQQTHPFFRPSSNLIMQLLQALFAAIAALLGRLRPAPTLAINQRRFTVVKQLGEGGFSFVYLAKERSTGAMFAIKRIRIQLPEQEERLRSEIAAHHAVDSPHVIKLLDSQTVLGPGGSIQEGLLLLPFYRGGTVQDLIDKLPPGEFLPMHRILRIAVDICKGLQAFHPPLAFRDLKPANILLDDSGRAVLMDLGSVALARVRISSRREAVALQELAAETVTAPFRAPELFDTPSDATITEATDVWALGCTIYAMGYRTSPYAPSRKVDGSQTAAVSGRVSFPANDPFGPQFRAVIEGIIQTQPASRPSVSQIEQLLTRLMGSISVGGM